MGPIQPPNPGGSHGRSGPTREASGTPSFSSKPQTSSHPGDTSSRGLSLRLPLPLPGIQVGHWAPLQLRELGRRLHSHRVQMGCRGHSERSVRGASQRAESRAGSSPSALWGGGPGLQPPLPPPPAPPAHAGLSIFYCPCRPAQRSATFTAIGKVMREAGESGLETQDPLRPPQLI